MSTGTKPAELSDIVSSVRRHWILVGFISLLGLAVGLLAIFVIPVQYTATASVSVKPLTADPLSTSTDSTRAVNMATEEQMARSRRVATAAVDRLGADSTLDVQTVIDGTTVETPQDSLVLNIVHSAPTARQAAAVANAVAESYLEVRRTDATQQLELLQSRTQEQIDRLKPLKANPDTEATDPGRRLQGVQADSLGSMIAELARIDVTPGRFVSRAVAPTHPSTPGAAPLGIAGLFLGLIVAVPVALTRKNEQTEINDVDGLPVTEHQLVLDGTQDDEREETWDLAAFMLKIPKRASRGRTIMIDGGEPASGRLAPGQELVDALGRRGETARFVDAGEVDGRVIGQGWPTEAERRAWNGEVVIVDTTNLLSDAHRVSVAENADAVILARSTADDVRTLRRLVGLLESKGANIALTALFPPRPEYTELTTTQ
ncbi:Wzz/FepE/Etk N-terminal domain-containing protein [Aeromicrobium sp.]|uniref:Wzz/FepE/Etk N-terminal domain-containing protein n=1 Tax=Aeromicrobium sp. TaxID=1871063 RepID=UPI003C5468A3